MCGEITYEITNNAEDFMWQEYGLELHVRENSLPKGTDKCKVKIKASVAGQYQFPEDHCPVSAVFWLRCEHMCEFSKPITLRMEHCSKSKKDTKFSFAKAFCTKKKASYIFEKLLGGCFNKVHGTIELRGFSGVVITEKNPMEQEYCAGTYLCQSRMTNYKIDFVVTSNTKAHRAVSCHNHNHASDKLHLATLLIQAVKKEYQEKDISVDLEWTFLFDHRSDNITIDVPLKGITEGGWKILPLTNPVVRPCTGYICYKISVILIMTYTLQLLKQFVDNYEEGKVSPKCRFSATALISDGEEVPPLQYQAKLLGAKDPETIVTFEIVPPTTISGTLWYIL